MALAATLVAGTAAGCGTTTGPSLPRPQSFPVAVRTEFPAEQRLAGRTSFILRITNVGRRAIPDVAVTVLNPRYGSAAQAFGELIPSAAQGKPPLASRSRPIWIIDQAPGPCRYSCRNRGPGGGATAYTDTWALGRLAPGHSVTFTWKLTAVQAGSYTVQYAAAADLIGNDRAVLSSGMPAGGRLHVRISSVPPNVTVASNGSIVQHG